MPDTTGRDSGGARGSKALPQAQRERELERRHKRAAFLRELDEARELRDRVQPRRARAARMRQQMRMRTFRW
jgi:16S rRNA G527 N7-methylase RsmG